MAGSSKGYARLSELGLRVVLIEPKNKTDFVRSLQLLGELFEIPPQQGAQAVWNETEKTIRAAATTLPPTLRGQSVYFEAGAPYAAGEASFVGELLLSLGMRNIVPAAMGSFPALSPEFVIAAKPDFVMMSDSASGDIAQRPGWRNLSALKTKQICRFSSEQNDVLVRPGPRMGMAAHILANCIRSASIKAVP
jgi:iron complex transport system substrate-binding protein